MITVVGSADGGHGFCIVGSHAAHFAVVAYGHAKAHSGLAGNLVSRQQGSILIVDDDAEILEIVCPAHYRKHQQEAQSAQSFHLFGHNVFVNC